MPPTIVPQLPVMRQQIRLPMLASEPAFEYTERITYQPPVVVITVQPLKLEEHLQPVMVAAGVQLPATLPLPSGTVMEWLITAGWSGKELGEAARIVECESQGHPDSYREDSSVYGLFQLWKGWWDYYNFDFDKWSDPVANATLAHKVYNYDIERGQKAWNQWQCQP